MHFRVGYNRLTNNVCWCSIALTPMHLRHTHTHMRRKHAPAIQLEGLPFAYDAFEPHISRQTMTLHHTKHHAKHVAIINGMIEGTDMEKDSLEVVLDLFCVYLACSCAHTKIHVP